MMKWYGKSILTKIETDTSRRLIRVGIMLVNHIKEQLSGAASKGGHSQPGEWPKKVSGHLRRNIAWEHDAQKLETRVGTNVPYGRYLELGTRFMARRPWLSRGLAEKLPDIQRVLAGGAA